MSWIMVQGKVKQGDNYFILCRKCNYLHLYYYHWDGTSNALVGTHKSCSHCYE